MSAQEEGAKEQDKYLPIANIARIMKKALPPNAKVAKDAKETVQECVSEFISFITSEVSLGKEGREKGEGGKRDRSANLPSAKFFHSSLVRSASSLLSLSSLSLAEGPRDSALFLPGAHANPLKIPNTNW